MDKIIQKIDTLLLKTFMSALGFKFWILVLKNCMLNARFKLTVIIIEVILPNCYISLQKIKKI